MRPSQDRSPFSDVGAYQGRPMDLPQWLLDPAGFESRSTIPESTWAKMGRPPSGPGSRPGSRSGSRPGSSAGKIGCAPTGFTLERLASRLGPQPPEEREAEIRRLLRLDEPEIEVDSLATFYNSKHKRPLSGQGRRTPDRWGSRTPTNAAHGSSRGPSRGPSPAPPRGYGHAGMASEGVCTVCSLPITSKSEMRELPCGHGVHWNCLGLCIDASASCPECARPLDANARQAPPFRPGQTARQPPRRTPVPGEYVEPKLAEDASAELAARALLAAMPKPQEAQTDVPAWRQRAGAAVAARPRSTLRALASAAAP